MRLLSDAELLLVSGADSPPSQTQIDTDTTNLTDGIHDANIEGLAELVLGEPPVGAAAEILITIGNWDNSPTGQWAQHSTDPAVHEWLQKLGDDLAANPWGQAVQDDIKGLKDSAKADGGVDDEGGGGGGNGSGGGCSTTYGGGGTSGGYTPPGTVTVIEDPGWS
jgi:hypothetical protein